jgi:hypothetical protein
VLDPDDHATLAEPPASTPATPAAADAPAHAEGEAIQAAPAAPTVTPNAAATAKDGGDENEAVAPNDDAEQAALEAKLDAAKTETSAEPAAAGADRGMTSLGDVPGEGAGAGGAPSQPKAQTKSGGSAGPASGRWDIISRGDRLRQAGDCVAARDEYAVALEDDEPRVRARAFAGIGLCDAAAGDEASADANYERARVLDGEVGSFIESQSERSRGGDKKSRKPAKKSKIATDSFDPFG